MKIGILTRRYGYNMGSTLQAFAICELIKALGYDVEIIDYDETTKYPRWKIRPLIEHALYPVKAILGRNKSIYLRHRQLQEKKFNSFEKKYLPLSCKRLSSDKSLKNISRNYYKIVAGSDQIWSPFLFDSNFLGGFLSQEEKNKFVPYAPSIGTSKIGDIGEKERHLLKELPILSCREDVGADIVSKITGKHVPVVLDPTLMVAKETWLNIADRHCIKNLPSNYIVTYFLGNDAHMDVVREIARK